MIGEKEDGRRIDKCKGEGEGCRAPGSDDGLTDNEVLTESEAGLKKNET